jgi:hypothetical protein
MEVAHEVTMGLPTDKAAVARVCAVWPESVADTSQLLMLVSERDDPVTRGAVLCRVGRDEEALKVLPEKGDPSALLYRALAEYQRKRPDAAKAAMEQAESWLNTPDPEDPEQTQADHLTWQRRLEVYLLRGEVCAVLRLNN